MEPITLSFSVKTATHRRDDPRAEQADKEFAGRRKRAIARDGWRCRACGCPSRPAPGHPSGGLEVHHLDDDHHNNALANLVTLCPLCHGILHIGWTARHRPGRFIWLPEMGQERLNMLVHMAAIARHRAGEETNPGERPRAAGTSRRGNEDERTPSTRLAGNLAALHARLAGIAPPARLLVGADGTELGSLLTSQPWSLGAILGRLAREGRRDAAGLDRLFGGLRWLYDLEADERAPVYSACQAWAPGAGWAAAWMREGLRCRGRLLRERVQKPGGAARRATGGDT